MPDFELSIHAGKMLAERAIKEEWLWETLENPVKAETKTDGTCHYIKSIEANQGRRLRVIVNADSRPKIVITAFFDRRLGREE